MSVKLMTGLDPIVAEYVDPGSRDLHRLVITDHKPLIYCKEKDGPGWQQLREAKEGDWRAVRQVLVHNTECETATSSAVDAIVQKEYGKWADALNVDARSLHDFQAAWESVENSIHENACNKGFWEDGVNRNFGEAMMLVVTELAEAVEAYRRNPEQEDEHIPDWRSVEVELADAIIRMMDLAGGMAFDVCGAVLAKAAYNTSRDYKHGKRF